MLYHQKWMEGMKQGPKVYSNKTKQDFSPWARAFGVLNKKSFDGLKLWLIET